MSYNPNSTGNSVKIGGSTSGTLSMVASAITANYSIKWPAAQGTGAVTNDGSGNLSFTAVANAALSNVSGFTANGIIFASSGTALSSSSNLTFNGSQAIFNVVDSYGGFKIKGRSGGEASFSLQPDTVADGTAGQWIFYTNGAGLNNPNDFAMYNSQLSTPAMIIQAATGNVGIGNNNPPAKFAVGSNFTVDSSGDATATGLVLNGSTSGFVKLVAYGTTASYILTMPGAQGTGALLNDGAGNLSWGTISAGANVTLSNLTNTQINTDLIPAADDSENLGSSSFRWANVYTAQLTGGAVTSSALTVNGASTFAEFLSITNATTDGTSSSPTSITTGDPNTVGLAIHGTSYNGSGFGPGAPTMQNLVNMTYASPTLSGTTVGTTWACSASSVQSFIGDGYVSCSINSTTFGAAFGLSTSATNSTPTYAGITYSMNWDSLTNVFYIYNSGGVLASFSGTLSSGDVLKIQRSGTSIIWMQNSTVLYTLTGQSASTTLYGAFAAETNPGDGAQPTVTLSNISMFYGAVEHQTSDLLDFYSDSGSIVAKVDANGNISSTGAISGLTSAFGSSGQCAVDSSGNVNTSGNVTIGGQLKVAGNAEYNAGNSGTAITINWNNGSNQLVTMTGNAAFTFSNPYAGSTYVLRLVQNGTGGYAATWPAGTLWQGMIPPALTPTAGAIDIITLYYNGTNYFGTYGLNYG